MKTVIWTDSTVFNCILSQLAIGFTRFGHCRTCMMWLLLKYKQWNLSRTSKFKELWPSTLNQSFPPIFSPHSLPLSATSPSISPSTFVPLPYSSPTPIILPFSLHRLLLPLLNPRTSPSFPTSLLQFSVYCPSLSSDFPSFLSFLILYPVPMPFFFVPTP